MYQIKTKKKTTKKNKTKNNQDKNETGKKVQVSCNFYTCDGSRGTGNMRTHPRTVKTVVVQIA